MEWVLPAELLLVNRRAKDLSEVYVMLLITKPVLKWADPSRERAVVLNKSVPPFLMRKI